jgi:ABC-2 type transport system ATP-binding protein
MLKVENVTKYYGNFKAVDNLSFEVNKGEIFGLLGVNGAGKTTTFRMIMGLLTPNSGNITLDSKPIDYNVTDEIGFLTEERSLLTKLTVLQQAIFYGSLKSMKKKEIETRLDTLLERFSIAEYKNKKIKELSKGNQQKVQFIMAILNKPKLLILDEPFSGLDPFNVELFKEVILELSKEGSMIIFSSHRMDHVELFCRKLVILMHGKSVLEGDLEEIKESYGYKNILINGDIDISKIEKIKGVISIKKDIDYQVKVEDRSVAPAIFKALKDMNVTKFVIENPSLNEIFIEKVGSSYEK